VSVFLDNQSVTQPSTRVVARLQALLQRWGNPYLMHSFCQEQLGELERCQQILHTFLGAHPEDTIVTTSSGAEAINQLVRGVAQIGRMTGKNEVLITECEEAPITLICQRLAQSGELKVKLVPLQDGQIDMKAFAESITPRTLLASLSWASGLTGVIQPIDALCTLCEERGVFLHLDASHVAASMELELQRRKIDAITLEGSLLHAPAGTGLLYLRRPIRLAPLIEGSQEQSGLRGGPLPLYLVGALAEACVEAQEQREAMLLETSRLRYRLETELHQATPLFSHQNRLPHITALHFPQINSDALLYMLGQKGIFGSMGGHNHRQLSQLLQSCGIAAADSWCAISLGLSRLTQERDIDHAIKCLNEVVDQLKRLGSHL
jgi:cysteine desulfurase